MDSTGRMSWMNAVTLETSCWRGLTEKEVIHMAQKFDISVHLVMEVGFTHLPWMTSSARVFIVDCSLLRPTGVH